jgi:hypothetical protein
MTSRRSSGSTRAERVFEPTKSENITVIWRRSAASCGQRVRQPEGAGFGKRVISFSTNCLRRVAELAAEKAGWGRQLPKGHGLGIAAHRSFVSYIATVVEVAAGRG